jgi:hypothetical protein
VADFNSKRWRIFEAISKNGGAVAVPKTKMIEKPPVIPELLLPLIGTTYQFNQGYLISEEGKNRYIASYEGELKAPLEFVNSHFSKEIVRKIYGKLKNPPQLNDTIFEIGCMMKLSKSYKIHYEPKTGGGRYADFRFQVVGIGRVYVECKNVVPARLDGQKGMNEVNQAFEKIWKGSDLVSEALKRKIRIECAPSKRLNSKQISQLEKVVRNADHSILEKDSWQPIAEVTVYFRGNLAPCALSGLRYGIIVEVVDKPINVTLENACRLYYAWPKLGRESVKNLNSALRSARYQLKGMPSRSIGVIWLNTSTNDEKSQMLLNAVGRPEFERIPVIITRGKLFYRGGHEKIGGVVRDAIFETAPSAI